MKMIISGVPCCGKTHFGDWLRDEHGFAHANLEGRRTEGGVIVPPGLSLQLPLWLSSVSKNVVVTWGFPPTPQCMELINVFQKSGFTAWWFEADHDIARDRYISRDGIDNTVKFFDPQIAKLKAASSRLKATYGKHTIVTLTSEGYLPLGETYRRLIGGGTQE